MALESIFLSFTSDKPEMDGRTFVKVCKDCKLFDKSYTNTDADLIFAKSKQKGQRTISAAEFENAMQFVAEKKRVSYDDIVNYIKSAGGPVYSGTKAQPNRFHDDKSLYTGVYANGGPSTVDTGRTQIDDLSQLADRSPANVRGGKF